MIGKSNSRKHRREPIGVRAFERQTLQMRRETPLEIIGPKAIDAHKQHQGLVRQNWAGAFGAALRMG